MYGVERIVLGGILQQASEKRAGERPGIVIDHRLRCQAARCAIGGQGHPSAVVLSGISASIVVLVADASRNHPVRAGLILGPQMSCSPCGHMLVCHCR